MQPANMSAQNNTMYGHSFPTWGRYDQYQSYDVGYGQQPTGLGATDMGGNQVPPWPADQSQGQGYVQVLGYDQHPGYNYAAVGEDSGTESDTSSDYDDYDQAVYERGQFEPHVATMTPEQQDFHYWQTYRNAKRSYRSHF